MPTVSQNLNMLMMDNYLCGFEEDLLDLCYESMDTYDPGFEEDFSHSPFGSNGEENDCSDLETSLLAYGSLEEGCDGEGNVRVGLGVSGSAGIGKKTFYDSNGKPVKKAQQRRAANMRERRRMKSINDAFDKLRTCIPATVTTERRLSKVDTLRLAIRYIDYLSDLVQSCNSYGNDKKMMKSPRHQEKVIIWCHITTQTEDLFSDSLPETELVCHSLSWEDESASKISLDKRQIARTWHPEAPTESDIVNLASYGNWEHRS